MTNCVDWGIIEIPAAANVSGRPIIPHSFRNVKKNFFVKMHKKRSPSDLGPRATHGRAIIAKLISGNHAVVFPHDDVASIQKDVRSVASEVAHEQFAVSHRDDLLIKFWNRCPLHLLL